MCIWQCQMMHQAQEAALLQPIWGRADPWVVLRDLRLLWHIQTCRDLGPPLWCAIHLPARTEGLVLLIFKESSLGKQGKTRRLWDSLCASSCLSKSWSSTRFLQKATSWNEALVRYCRFGAAPMPISRTDWSPPPSNRALRSKSNLKGVTASSYASIPVAMTPAKNLSYHPFFGLHWQPQPLQHGSILPASKENDRGIWNLSCNCLEQTVWEYATKWSVILECFQKENTLISPSLLVICAFVSLAHLLSFLQCLLASLGEGKVL